MTLLVSLIYNIDNDFSPKLLVYENLKNKEEINLLRRITIFTDYKVFVSHTNVIMESLQNLF